MFNKFLILSLFLILNFLSFSQNEDKSTEGATFNFNKEKKAISRKHQLNFTPYYGFPHLEKMYQNLIIQSDSTIDMYNFKEVNVKGYGPLGLRGEFFLNNYIAVGFDFMYNQYSINIIDEYEYFDYTTQANKTVTDVYKYTLKRYRIQAKCNMHFKSLNPNLDTYVGIGIGLSHRKAAFTENGKSDPEIDIDLNSDINLIPLSLRTAFGLRYYFTRNIGLNAEIGIGGPLISTGIVFRFNQKY
jgi:hypothetical protein